MNSAESDLPAWLARQLSQGLPGRRGQARFAAEMSYGRHSGPPAADARRAAVMILLCPDPPQWSLPLTVRRPELPLHAGQISLPGGMLEPGESSAEAAVRELEEELGLRGERLQMLGRLSSLYVFNSNVQVVPWVAWTERMPAWRPNPQEVADVFPLPLEVLRQGHYRQSFTVTRGRLSFRAPCFCWQQYRVWGATAMILGEFAALLEHRRHA